MTRSRAAAHPGTLQASIKAQSHVTGRTQRGVRDRSIASLLWRVRHDQKPCRPRTIDNSRADGAYYGRTCHRVKMAFLVQGDRLVLTVDLDAVAAALHHIESTLVIHLDRNGAPEQLLNTRRLVPCGIGGREVQRGFEVGFVALLQLVLVGDEIAGAPLRDGGCPTQLGADAAIGGENLYAFVAPVRDLYIALALSR